MNIEGNNNYAIKGDGNHLENNIYNIENFRPEYQNNPKQPLEEFFEIAFKNTPHFDYFFMSIGFLIFLFFVSVFHVDYLQLIATILVLSFLGYMSYFYLYTNLFEHVSITESKVIIGDVTYLYSNIRDPNVNGSVISFGFANSSDIVYLSLKKDAAGLLKHRIEMYKKYYEIF